MNFFPSRHDFKFDHSGKWAFVLQPYTNRHFYFLNLQIRPHLIIVQVVHVNDSLIGQGQDNSLDGPEFAREPNATVLASEVLCVGLCLPAEELNILTDIQLSHQTQQVFASFVALRAPVKPELLLLNPRIPMPHLFQPTHSLQIF